MLSAPCLELNDSPVMAFGQQAARDFFAQIWWWIEFDEMLDRSRDMPLVCSIVLHRLHRGSALRHPRPSAAPCCIY
jgi:hypothetical protein